MREINLSAGAMPGKVIPLYYQGEKNATCIRIDLSDYVALFGDGEAQLLYQRPGDEAPYAVTLTREGDVVSWKVIKRDVARPGRGWLQLVYTAGETEALSPKLATYAAPSLGQETDPPEEERPWYDEALQAAKDAEEAADRAEDAADRAEAAAEGGGGGTSDLLWRPTVSEDGEISWTQSASDTPPEPVNIMGPQGPAGADGATGPAGQDGATPNLQIGTVTTLDAGSNATATITGTAENPLLNLGVPRGADGSGGETKEWNIIFDEELETAIGSVAFDNLDLKELEVYVLLRTPYESTSSVYLTSSYDNGIYGDPRFLSVINANWIGVLFNKLEVVTNKLWKAYKNISPYFSMSNFAELSASYSNLIANHEFNIPKIEAFTLCAVEQFPVGTRIIIRGR